LCAYNLINQFTVIYVTENGHRRRIFVIYTVSQKKLSRFVFVRTASVGLDRPITID